MRLPFCLSPRAAAVVLLAGLASWPAVAPLAQNSQRLPALGDAVSDELDLLKERRLGDNIMRDLRKDPDYLEDAVLQGYLESIFQPLLQAARTHDAIDADLDQKFAWQPFLVRDRAVNAFALPGGYVGVYLGLIAMTATPDELASVLAHEMTHVTQRHIARSMSNASRQGMATMAAMLLGVLAAARSKSVDGVQAVVVGSQAMAAQGQLNFSRDMEREADRIGFELMSGAGFGALGMAGMFEKLEASSRLNDGGQYPYLRSHPLTSERITEARLRAGALPAAVAPASVLHGLMQARARVLGDGREPSLRRLQAQGALGSPAVDAARLAALYGAALASTRLRDFDRADATVDAGLALARQGHGAAPGVLQAWHLLRVEALLARAAGPVAAPEPLLRRLAAADAELAPDASRDTLLARAQLAQARWRLSGGREAQPLRQVTETLQTWVAEHRRDAPAWDALAQCAEPLGLKLRALQAGAEAASARGDVVGAVDRFRAAQKAAREAGPEQYAEASIIESRLREVEAERRRLIAEARGERYPE